MDFLQHLFDWGFMDLHSIAYNSGDTKADLLTKIDQA